MDGLVDNCLRVLRIGPSIVVYQHEFRWQNGGPAAGHFSAVAMPTGHGGPDSLLGPSYSQTSSPEFCQVQDQGKKAFLITLND